MRTVGLLVLLLFISTDVRAAWLWDSDNSLVTINDQVYSTDDFRHWLVSSKEEGEVLAESLETFIDWQLLAGEAEAMELNQEEGFIKKVHTFLRVRKFMQLKNEEIDAKTAIEESELRKRYDEMYSPGWQGRALFFVDEQAAMVAYQDALSQTRTEEELAEQPAGEGGPTFNKMVEFRPYTTPVDWLETMRGMEDGQVIGPLKYNGGYYVVFFLHEKRVPGDDDFERNRKRIHEEIFKEKQEVLTVDLIKKLRTKYAVTVDEDLLAELDYLTKPADELLAKPLISTNKEPFTVEYVWYKIGRNMENVKDSELESKKESVKGLTVDDIIAQAVLNWEAMSRPYEEEPPLKWRYQFYYKHRLNMAIESLLFRQPPQVTDDMIAKYYQENIVQFARPDILSYAYIPGDSETITRMWNEIVNGADFFQLGEQHYQHKVPEKSLTADKIEAAVLAELDKLVEGEMSAPFLMGENVSAIVKLLKRKASAPTPLTEVRGQIVQRIKDKDFNDKRDAYLKLLKSKSTIVVNDKNWQRFKEELEGNDDK